MPSTSQTRVPSYCKHKASGQAVVTLNGKGHYLGKYGTAASKREYNRVIAEWLASGGQARPAGEPLTINETILAYWRHAKDYYRNSPGEMARIREAVRPLKQLYGHTPAKDFGPLALKAVRQAMIDSGLARKTINMRIGAIKRMLKWAASDELIPAAVFHGVQAVDGLRFGRSDAKETEPIRPVPDAFVAAVLPHVCRQVAAMIHLQELTGARPGEVVIMRGCELDTSGRVWVFRPEQHKNLYRGRQREVYLGPKAQEVIKPFLQTDLQAYLFSPREAREERFRILRFARKTKVQPSQANRKKKSPKKVPGDRYTVESYRRAIKYGCRAADEAAHRERPEVSADERIIPDWHPHQLRHNAATNLRKEYGVELARIILGHATAFTTEIYAEADRQQAMEVIAKVG
jgi:integrase